MRKTTRIGFLALMLCCAAVALCLFVASSTAKGVYADGTNTEATIVNKYEGYVNYSGSALHNYSKRTSASSVAPTITVFVHGQGGHSGHWCNLNGGTDLLYNSSSLIEQARIAAGPNVSVYLAKVYRKYVECATPATGHVGSPACENGCISHQCTVNCERVFTLTKLTRGSYYSGDYYGYISEPVLKITDFNKHAIIIFEASETVSKNQGGYSHKFYGGDNASHDVAYMELNYVLDRIISDYRYITGVIPTINLISHSRGGILSMKYAIEHPYNVSSMISLGTPYSGSLFANSDWIVDGLNLRGATECPSGQDILSPTVQANLKNSWNTMINTYPNANINAVAIGSKTRLDFIAGLISGGYLNDYTGITSEFLNDLLAALTEYSGVAIAELYEMFPVITTIRYECFNLMIDVVQLFMNEYTSSQIQALQDIINNCEIAYGDLVIKDDLFIHYDSQTAVGFNGFNRFERIFNADNASYNLISTYAPPIPHNLEAQDPYIISYILSELSFGNLNENFYNKSTYDNQLNGLFTVGYYSEALFDALLEGEYTLNSNNLNFTVIEEETWAVVADSIGGNNTFRAYSPKRYRIFLTAAYGSPTIYGSLHISLPNLETVHGKNLYPNDAFSFVKVYNADTVKRFSINHGLTGVYVNGEEILRVVNYTFDMILRADVEYYFRWKNSSSSSVLTAYLSIGEIGSISKDVSITVACHTTETMVSYLSASTETCVFSFNCLDVNSIPEINIYGSDFYYKSNVMIYNSGNYQIYKFDIMAGEKIYISFVNHGMGTRPAVIRISDYVSDYYWTVDGNIIDNFILELKRDDTYSGTLAFCFNGQELVGQIIPVTDSNAFLSVDGNGSRVKVATHTPLTYGDVLYQYLVWQSPDGDARLNEALRIKVLPRKIPTISATNDVYNYKCNIQNADRQTFGALSETILITVRVRNHRGGTDEQIYTISSGNSLYDQTVVSYGYFGAGTIELRVIQLRYYYNNYNTIFNANDYPSLFVNQTATLYGYFNSGRGTAEEPYAIGNERELNNIRHSKTYFVNGYGFFEAEISHNFVLINDITLTYAWQPIDTNFKGVLNGNNKKIYNLQINCNTSQYSYGMFETVWGTVKNIKFYNVQIYGNSNNHSGNIYVGTIAGHNFNGTINNCDVYSGNVSIYYYKSFVGGVVGLSSGTVYDCDNFGATVYGCGVIGGVVGLNGSGGSVSCCWNEGYVEHYYDTENGCAGGIVGKNTYSAVISNCRNNGSISYVGQPSNNTEIAPCMAQIVGWLVSGEQTNNVCAGTTDYSNLKTSVGGFLGIGAKNQRRYCSNGAVGRMGD